jgi:hypothetical protein
MKTLKFHGYGDDTFGEYGITGQDRDNCANEKPIQCVVDCGERGNGTCLWDNTVMFL